MPSMTRSTHLDWEAAYKDHGSELARLEEFVESYEKENNLSLSPGAIELLFVPFIEILESGKKLDFIQVTTTFEILIATMKEYPSNRENNRGRSSLSVIKAFWKAWCNIPPICDETRNEPRGRARA